MKRPDEIFGRGYNAEKALRAMLEPDEKQEQVNWVDVIVGVVIGVLAGLIILTF